MTERRLTFCPTNDPLAFSGDGRVSAFLLGQKELNNVFLGVIQIAGRDGRQAFFFHVLENDEVLVAAIHTPPNYLLFAAPIVKPELSLDFVVEKLAEMNYKLDGILCYQPHAQSFAEKWTKKFGFKPHLRMRQRLHLLKKVQWERLTNRATGGFLKAVSADDTSTIDKCVLWHMAFLKDIDAIDAKTITEASARKGLMTMIDANRLFVWQTETEVLSMIAFKPTPPDSCRVVQVYTPPQNRQKGYATAMTAAFSEYLMTTRKYSCCLIVTDLANPISNSVYAKVGYEPIGEELWQYQFNE